MKKIFANIFISFALALTFVGYIEMTRPSILVSNKKLSITAVVGIGMILLGLTILAIIFTKMWSSKNSQSNSLKKSWLELGIVVSLFFIFSLSNFMNPVFPNQFMVISYFVLLASYVIFITLSIIRKFTIYLVESIDDKNKLITIFISIFSLIVAIIALIN